MTELQKLVTLTGVAGFAGLIFGAVVNYFFDPHWTIEWIMAGTIGYLAAFMVELHLRLRG